MRDDTEHRFLAILAQAKRVDAANKEILEAVRNRRRLFPEVVVDLEVLCRCAIGSIVTGKGMDERGRRVIVLVSAEFCEYVPLYQYAGAALCVRHEVLTRPEKG